MTRLLYRLRRSVALIICPEMGVEARLKSARAAGAFEVAVGQAKAIVKQQPLLQEARILHKTNGTVQVRGKRYWSEWMTQRAGEKIVVHFDPEDIPADVLIYSQAGAFMGTAEYCDKVGFFDLRDAKAATRDRIALQPSPPPPFSRYRFKGSVGREYWLDETADLFPCVTADVEVQSKPGGRWMPGQLINGKLHWVRPIPTAADLEAISLASRSARTLPTDAG